MRGSSHCRPPAHRVTFCPLSGLLAVGWGHTGGRWRITSSDPLPLLTAGPHGTSGTSRPCRCSCKYWVFLLCGSADTFSSSHVSVCGLNLVCSCYFFRDLKDFKATLVNLGNPEFL